MEKIKMKKLFLILAVLSAAFCVWAKQKSAEENMNEITQNMTKEQKEVYDSYRASCDAMIKKDKAALEKYFDKDLVFVHMSGKRQTRSEYIGEIMDGTLNYFKITDKKCEIQVDGSKAVMKVRHALNAKVYGMSGEWTMGGTFRYEKRGGIWVHVEN